MKFLDDKIDSLCSAYSTVYGGVGARPSRVLVAIEKKN